MTTSFQDDEQKTKLQEAGNSVKKNAYYLQRAVVSDLSRSSVVLSFGALFLTNTIFQDDDNLKDALRYAAALLGELRTSLLSPKRYYELYIQETDHLTNLELYFQQEETRGRSLKDLYGLVQHAGNVLPRLYLLCTVGACCIRAKVAPAQAILKDMVEMCRGVQHPTRGLFLRAYLVQVCRGLLPDTDSEYEGGENGTVDDAIDFLLLNFTEMNKLWVRMRHQGSARDAAKIEAERAQLADLVGKNLTQLSQLDGLSFELYNNVVLPRVLEQVVNCKDDLAQQYLMQCLIMGFPDDFHLGTLGTLLGALPSLQAGVKLHSVMASLLDRLASFASTGGVDAQSQLVYADAFGKACSAASESIEKHPDVPAGDVAALYGALLSFVGAVHPDRVEYADKVLKMCYSALKVRNPIDEDPRAERALVSLLSSSLERYDPVTVLGLDNFMLVVDLLTPDKRRDIAIKIAQAVVKNGGDIRPIASLANVDRLFLFLMPLSRDDEGLNLDDEDIREDASLLAKVVHSIKSTDAAEHLELLKAAQKYLLAGGAQRAVHTLPALCFCVLDVCGKDAATFDKKPWFLFLLQTAVELADLSTPGSADIAFQVIVQCGCAAADAGFEEVGLDCLERAFMLYEESMANSKSQLTAICSACGALQRCTNFSADNRGVLVSKLKSYSGGLLSKADQSTASLRCAHLYWQDEGGVRLDEEVFKCLQRSYRVAQSAIQQQERVGKKGKAGLMLVDILSSVHFFSNAGVENLDAQWVETVTETAKSEVGHAEADELLQSYFERTTMKSRM